MTQTRRMPAAGERWRHCKGTAYLIVGVAWHTETQEEMVLYWADRLADREKLWARPLAMFLDRHTSGAWRFEREPEKPAIPLSSLVGRGLRPDPTLDALRTMEGEAERNDGKPSLTR